MKIICTKEELTMLVRSCMYGSHDENCCGCAFADVCSQDGDPQDGDIMCRIEDICEISDVG